MSEVVVKDTYPFRRITSLCTPLATGPPATGAQRGGSKAQAQVQPSAILPRLSIRGRELTISAGVEWHADEHTKIDVLTVCADVLKIYEDMLPMGPICGGSVTRAVFLLRCYVCPDGVIVVSFSSRIAIA